MDKITLKSKRFDMEYQADLYMKDDALVIRHTSLDRIYWELPDDKRPKFKIEPFNVAQMPGIPPVFAVKCIMDSADFHIECIGELLCQTWQGLDPISYDFPISKCINRAFDKAFLRFMQFDIDPYRCVGIYSSEEIHITEAMVPVMDKNITQIHESSNAGNCAVNIPESTPNMQGNESDNNMGNIENMSYPPFQEPGNDINPSGFSDQPVYDQMTLPTGMEDNPFPWFQSDENDMPAESANNWFSTPQDFSSEPEGPYYGPDICPGDFYGNSPLVDQSPQLPDFITNNNSPFPYIINSEEPIPKHKEKIVNIRRISYDNVLRKCCIETNNGIFYYNSSDGTWDSPAIDVQTIDLSDLYAKCSDMVHMELKDYKGFI